MVEFTRWRIIQGALQDIRLGIKKSIGNGLYTNLYYDPWIFCIPLAWQPTFVNVDAMLDSFMVSDLIQNGTWNDDLISDFFFGVALISRIKYIYVSPYACDDVWVWEEDALGTPNARSVYNVISPLVLPTPEVGWIVWQKIWKIKVPPKIYFFLWKLAHSRLPTLDVIQNFNPSTNATCLVCGHDVETNSHLFFLCSIAN